MTEEMPQAATVAESTAAGKEARKRFPRSAHADWQAAKDRESPVAIIEGQDKSRVPELVPIRHGRMSASAFTFYRGAAAVMAADLASQPNTGLDAQLCGDAHLSNFGIFNAPDRQLVFDVNDFDETHPGPFEWDLKRLVASFAIGGRDLGFKEKDRRAAVQQTAKSYREEIRRLAEMRTIDVWYQRLDVRNLERYRSMVDKQANRNFRRNIAKAESKNSLRAFNKLTERVNGKLQIKSDPPLIVPIEDVVAESGAKVSPEQFAKRLRELLTEYRGTLDRDVAHLIEDYHYVHAARKVVGVGSVGTRAWIVLMLGRDTGDPLFLQIKEAEDSVLEGFAGRSRYRQAGRRVVEGQRLMQAAGDIFLGWLTAAGPDGVSRDFYVRQLWDGKGSAAIESMDPYLMGLYGQLCGWTLARAHARSGDRIAIASYLGKGKTFDEAMADFAEAYADQNEKDYAELMKAIKDGELKSEPGI